MRTAFGGRSLRTSSRTAIAVRCSSSILPHSAGRLGLVGPQAVFFGRRIAAEQREQLPDGRIAELPGGRPTQLRGDPIAGNEPIEPRGETHLVLTGQALADALQRLAAGDLLIGRQLRLMGQPLHAEFTDRQRAKLVKPELFQHQLQRRRLRRLARVGLARPGIGCRRLGPRGGPRTLYNDLRQRLVGRRDRAAVLFQFRADDRLQLDSRRAKGTDAGPRILSIVALKMLPMISPTNGMRPRNKKSPAVTNNRASIPTLSLGGGSVAFRHHPPGNYAAAAKFPRRKFA